MTLEEIPMPDRIRNLPVDPVRKFPVPWFVDWIDGKPEFRAMDPAKLIRAIKEKRCWVCGEPLGKLFTFVVGPMCGINRTSSEPPSHTDCARYSARACPFLSRPHMDRRELEGSESPAGHMIMRNPGVTLLWTARGYRPFNNGRGGVLLQLGDPISLEWFREGRPATRAEVEESVRTGLPALEALAAQQEGGIEALHKAAEAFSLRYPA